MAKKTAAQKQTIEFAILPIIEKFPNSQTAFAQISLVQKWFSLQRGTCIKGLIWPPLEPKTENCFSQISFDWFIRRITEV